MVIKGKQTKCVSCEYYGRIVFNNGIQKVWCTNFKTEIGEFVSECSGYSSFMEDEPYSMVKAAWVIEVDKRGQVAGFKPPKKKGWHES